jgi:hypothetical protein
MKPLSATFLVLFGAAVVLQSIPMVHGSAYSSLSLVGYPNIIPANAPMLSVTTEIPDTIAYDASLVVVVDIIAKSDIDQATKTYKNVAARAVIQEPDERVGKLRVVVPISKSDFDVNKQPYYIHAWIGPAGLIESNAVVAIQDPTKLSHPLALVTNQIGQTYTSEQINCVDNEYIGFILDTTKMGPTLNDNVQDLVDQGLNLFRTALPKPLSNAELKNLDVSELKSLVDFIQKANAQPLIDLPLFYKPGSVPYNAVLDATKGQGNIFLVPRPANVQDQKTVLSSIATALGNSPDQVLLPSQIIFGNTFGLKNVAAHRVREYYEAVWS